MFSKKNFKKTAILILAAALISSSFVLSPINTPVVNAASTITVDVATYGYTSTAVQNAINAANAGDTVYLPGSATPYDFTSTVTVNKAITISGDDSLTLQNLCVPEYGANGTDVPPTWSATPPNCYANDSNIKLFTITSSNVTLKNLKLTGRTTETSGDNYGIYILSSTNRASYVYDNLTVIGCEISGHNYGIDFVDSYNGLVKGCYIHDNKLNGSGYGVCINGWQMSSGGSTAVIRENEFMANRHDVATNSPNTKFIVYKNYTHDDNESQHEPCFDLHPEGAATIMGAVRNNIFVRTWPGGFNSGSLQITGNYYDEGCENYIVDDAEFRTKPAMNLLNVPWHSGSFEPNADLHDIYVSGNTNNSSVHDTWVRTFDYTTQTKTGPNQSYVVNDSMYENGVLFAHDSYDSSPYPPLRATGAVKPLLGEVYVTQAGTSTKVDSIDADTWYDLDAMACDPQGAGNIARIGIQLRDPKTFNYTPGNADGIFRANGNYYIETDGTNVYVRKNEGSTTWTTVSANTQDLFVDTNYFQYYTDGSARKHFKIRFKVLNDAASSEWFINGYAKDAQGNYPTDRQYYDQLEWFLNVNNPDAPAPTPTPMPSSVTHMLTFSHLDSRNVNTGDQGYHFMQALIDDGNNITVVWEKDASADAANTWFTEKVDVTQYVQGKSNVSVKFRVYEKRGVSNLAASVYYDDVSLDGFTVSNSGFETTGSWNYSSAGSFSGAYSTSQHKSGAKSYKISLPTNTSTNPGDYGCITQSCSLVPKYLNFSHMDNREANSYDRGYHFMQALINNQVVWEKDVAAAGDGANTWYTESVNVAQYVQGQPSVDLVLRVYEKTGVSNMAVDVYYDDVSLDGFTVSNNGYETTGSWNYSSAGSFSGAYSTSQYKSGAKSYKISLPADTSTNPDDYGCIAQSCSLVPKYLNFSYMDNRGVNTVDQGYHFIQAMINNQVVWENDTAADGANTWYTGSVDVAQYIQEKSIFDLKFRVYDKKDVSNLNIEVYLDDVSLDGFTVSNSGFETTGSWNYSSLGSFSGAYSTSQYKSGARSYKISLPVDTHTNPYDYGCITQTCN